MASARKREFADYAQKHMINYPEIVKWEKRQISSKKISKTARIVEVDDLHFINNPAMQQMWDDIRRTAIFNLDEINYTLEKIFNKEITPETMNNYLEILNHVMPGGAVIQEHMCEIHPGIVDDCMVRIFTGDDNLADEIDNQYLININKLFPADHAEALKAAIGKTTWQAIHIPTIVSRSCDGASASRWSAMQISLAFIDAYNLSSGGSDVSELSFVIKNQDVLRPGGVISPGGSYWNNNFGARIRWDNNPGGLSFGYLADIVQTSRLNPQDPVKISLNTVAAGAMLYDQIYLYGHNSGETGLAEIACSLYTNDILDGSCYDGCDYGTDKYGGFCKMPFSLSTVKDLATEITARGMAAVRILSYFA